MKDQIMQRFPDAQLTDAHNEMLAYQLAGIPPRPSPLPPHFSSLFPSPPSPHCRLYQYLFTLAVSTAEDVDLGAGGSTGLRNASIAPVFAFLIGMGELIEDFAVSQTTLEQVFLKLAKEEDSR